MSDTPETLAAILAEMRDFCSGWSEDVDVTVKVGLIYGWMCRIEAAAERERNAHTNDIHDALYLATGIPGNTSAMREALEEIYNEAQNICDYCDEQRIVSHRADKIERIVNTALAVPARNADRFHTADEARDAVKAAFANTMLLDDRQLRAVCDWLFAPAEGVKE